jgi:hypothetical protein
VAPSVSHTEFRDDLVAVLNKHAGHLSAVEMLALASNAVGQIIALQDQRVMDKDAAMRIVKVNIAVGNEIAQRVLNEPEGHA